MRTFRRRLLPLLAVLVMVCATLTVPAFAADDPTEETGTKMIECPDCGTLGVVLSDGGEAVECESCAGSGYVESPTPYFNSALALLPPVDGISPASSTNLRSISSFVFCITVGRLICRA